MLGLSVGYVASGSRLLIALHDGHSNPISTNTALEYQLGVFTLGLKRPRLQITHRLCIIFLTLFGYSCSLWFFRNISITPYLRYSTQDYDCYTFRCRYSNFSWRPFPRVTIVSLCVKIKPCFVDEDTVLQKVQGRRGFPNLRLSPFVDSRLCQNFLLRATSRAFSMLPCTAVVYSAEMDMSVQETPGKDGA